MNTNKNAFTMVEIMITLLIVGVVAAMTIPALNNKIRENIIVNKVTKNYAMLSNALRLAIADNGPVDTWSIGNSLSGTNFTNILKKYFKWSQDCGTKSGCIYTGMYKEYVSGKLKNCTNYNSQANYYKIKLLDGGVIWVRQNNSSSCDNSDTGTQNVCALIWYDYNGKRPPNVIGEDTFVYFVQPDKLIPHGTISSADKCKDKKSSWACTSYILKYKNMDYMH